MREIWKNIPECPGYQASNTGFIKSLARYVKHPKGSQKLVKERVMKNQKGTNGYFIVGISKKGVTHSKTVHRLIARAFIPNPKKRPEVNHKDGNKKNNVVSNLEWATVSENRFHAFRTGLQKAPYSMRGKKDGLCCHSIPVFQVLSNGCKVKFASATTAERKLGVSRRGISQSARGLQDYAGGFKWEYE